MNEFKIEKKKDLALPIPKIGTNKRTKMLQAIKKLEVGESFVMLDLGSYERNGIIAAKILLDRDFIVRKDGIAYRIWRVA